MLAFTERAGAALHLVLDAARGNRTGVRISGRAPSMNGLGGLCVLELSVVAHCDMDDEWLISPSGIPVFVDPDIVGFLKGRTLDASIDADGVPKFVVRPDEHAMGELP
jgi:Fe-S cluster assembly iron-binding protein IscA